jgi:hypothetical protein
MFLQSVRSPFDLKRIAYTSICIADRRHAWTELAFLMPPQQCIVLSSFMSRCRFRYIQAYDLYRQSDELEQFTFDSSTPSQWLFLQEANLRKCLVACWLEVEVPGNSTDLSPGHVGRHCLWLVLGLLAVVPQIGNHCPAILPGSTLQSLHRTVWVEHRNPLANPGNPWRVLY